MILFLILSTADIIQMAENIMIFLLLLLITAIFATNSEDKLRLGITQASLMILHVTCIIFAPNKIFNCESSWNNFCIMSGNTGFTAM